MAKVVLRDLNKKYDDTHAVKDVNLEIHDREFVVLVGPSGCGKTTTRAWSRPRGSLARRIEGAW